MARHRRRSGSNAPDLSRSSGSSSDILLQVLKPEPAERVAMMMVMLIDGAIAAQQAESAECREIPPGVTAWSAAKALIYSEGGTL